MHVSHVDVPQAHKAYLESTEHRTASFKALTKNDASAAKVIEQRMKKLIKLQVGNRVCQHVIQRHSL